MVWDNLWNDVCICVVDKGQWTASFKILTKPTKSKNNNKLLPQRNDIQTHQENKTWPLERQGNNIDLSPVGK